ncbi:MAG: thioredoxin family protein [Gammaproteobacteria bacterium]
MNTPRVELVYFTGCPNVAAARGAIREAMTAEGLTAEWREWNRDDAATPDALRGYGSPTVLVDGHDVVPASSDANCCRVYPGDSGLLSTPSVESIRAALSIRSDKEK